MYVTRVGIHIFLRMIVIIHNTYLVFNCHTPDINWHKPDITHHQEPLGLLNWLWWAGGGGRP